MPRGARRGQAGVHFFGATAEATRGLSAKKRSIRSASVSVGAGAGPRRAVTFGGGEVKGGVGHVSEAAACGKHAWQAGARLEKEMWGLLWAAGG